jgi:hypothetical protein
VRPPTICDSCARVKSLSDETATCEAFPSGIPVDVASGRTGHLLPLKGDHGKQHVLRDDPFAAGDFAVWERYVAAQARP